MVVYLHYIHLFLYYSLVIYIYLFFFLLLHQLLVYIPMSQIRLMYIFLLFVLFDYHHLYLIYNFYDVRCSLVILNNLGLEIYINVFFLCNMYYLLYYQLIFSYHTLKTLSCSNISYKIVVNYDMMLVILYLNYQNEILY